MKTIRNLLENNNSSLSKLLSKCQTADDLAKLFSTIVDGSFAKHCKLANYRQGKLTLVVTSPVWATKVRYAAPELIKTLRVHPEFSELKKINYEVDKLKIEAQTKRQTLKKAGRSSINQAAWQEALERLKKQVCQRHTLT